jgi:plasmid stabilization system protein ParE
VYALSRRAQADLRRIISGIAENDQYGGVAAARRISRILDRHMRRIAEGRVVGHRNDRMRTKRPLLYSVARPTKYMIAFDPDTREIAGIAYGGQDPDAMFADA